MKQPFFVTTSWDDGHPSDIRIAGLLEKHGLPGTFYIPRTSEQPTMTESQIRDLSPAFEIGAHTLRHVDLDSVEFTIAEQEIVDSRRWLEDVTGDQCRMFCFPLGRFRREHLSVVREAGYVGARTVELLSTAFPENRDGLLVMPTTVQAYPHRADAYIRNGAKRRSFRSLWWFVIHGFGQDWHDLARDLWMEAQVNGGVWHLWGHSWEIDDHEQWQRLEQVFAFMSRHRATANFMTNGEICERFNAYSLSRASG